MNKWIGTGRLVAEPNISMSQGGTKIAKYRLAVNRPKKQDGTQEADFISCICFNKGADFVEKHLHKGTKIGVVGRIQTGSYEKDGVKHYTTDIIVEEHEFMESKAAIQRNAVNPTISPSDDFPQATPDVNAFDGFSEINNEDGDLPF